MAFLGLRTTDSPGVDERPKNFFETILRLAPNGMSPLTALMALASTTTTDDPEFSWWEETNDLTQVQLGAAALVGDTTLTLVSGGHQLRVGDILQVTQAAHPTVYAPANFEFVEVTAVTSDVSIDVIRGAVGTTAAAIPDQTFLEIQSSAHVEGGNSPGTGSRNPDKYFNYTQIFKTAVSISGTAQATRLRTGDAFTQDHLRKMFDHSVKMEKAFLTGVPLETTKNGERIRYTGGLEHFLTTHRHVETVAMTEDRFLDITAPLFDFSGDNADNSRLILCGNNALNALNKVAKNSPSSRLNHGETVKLIGMELETWVIPQGRFAIKTHPLLNRSSYYSNSMFIINMAGLRWRPLEGRDTKLQRNIQLPDEDKQKDQWLTEGGFMVSHEETMSVVHNVFYP